MNYKDLQIGHWYNDKDLGTVLYMGRFKMDFFVEGEKGRKGERVFKVPTHKGRGLCSLTKKQIETDLKKI